MHSLVEWLLDKNASAELPNNDQKTAWEIAFENNDYYTMQIYINRLCASEVKGLGFDIRRELSMIRSVLLQQEKVWENLSAKICLALPKSSPTAPRGSLQIPKKTGSAKADEFATTLSSQLQNIKDSQRGDTDTETVASHRFRDSIPL